MPPSGRYPWWAIQSSLRAGHSLEQAFRFAQQRGFQVSRQTFTKAYGAARAELEAGAVEPLRPLNRFPVGDEINQRDTVRATGYSQKVLVLARDKRTREIIVKPWTMTSRGLLTRQGAIAQAVEAYREFEDRYNQTVIGGVYAGTFQLTPGLE